MQQKKSHLYPHYTPHTPDATKCLWEVASIPHVGTREVLWEEQLIAFERGLNLSLEAKLFSVTALVLSCFHKIISIIECFLAFMCYHHNYYNIVHKSQKTFFYLSQSW